MSSRPKGDAAGLFPFNLITRLILRILTSYL